MIEKLFRIYRAMIWDEFLRHFRFCDEEDSGLSDEEQERKVWRNSKQLLNMNSSFGRGVSHTPESIHVDKLVYPGVCDTPLHVCKKAHAFLSYYNVRTGTI